MELRADVHYRVGAAKARRAEARTGGTKWDAEACHVCTPLSQSRPIRLEDRGAVAAPLPLGGAVACDSAVRQRRAREYERELGGLPAGDRGDVFVHEVELDPVDPG